MRKNCERRSEKHDFLIFDSRGMVASTRAASLSAQTPLSAPDDNQEESLVNKRMLEVRLAKSHQAVFIFSPDPPRVILQVTW